MNPLIVIGLDGMTWAVADKLKLPAIERLTEKGGRSTLRSTDPPVTCPAWPSYLTGKQPKKHRAFDFCYLDENKTSTVRDYTSIKTPSLIDVMDQESLPSIFFEIPLTYPAPDGKPMVVAGYPAKNEEQKFSPAGLRESIESDLGEFPPITPGRYTGNNKEDVLDSFFSATQYRKDAFTRLLANHEWSFATCNFHLPDQFGHFFWNLHEESDNKTDPLSQAYRLVDDVVDEIVSTVPDNTNVLVISDHGHGKQNYTVNLNYLLWREGYLKFESNPLTQLKLGAMKSGLTPATFKTLADRLGLTWFMGIMNRSTRDKILSTFLSFRDVDWDQTEAYAFGHVGQIYWIGDDETRRDQLKMTLMQERTNGNQLIDELISLHEETPPKSDEPMWLTKMDNWANIAYPLLIGKWDLLQAPTNAGCHRPNGILVWDGPDLGGKAQPDARITDIAPTAHRLLELPPQHNFDGETLTEILNEDAPDPKQPRDYSRDTDTKSTDDEEQVKDQLRNLGYL